MILKEIGARAIPELIKSLGNKSVRKEIVTILGNISDDRAIEPLINILFDGNEDFRLNVISNLLKFDKRDVLAVLRTILSRKSVGTSNMTSKKYFETRRGYSLIIFATLLDNKSDYSYVCSRTGDTEFLEHCVDRAKRIMGLQNKQDQMLLIRTSLTGLKSKGFYSVMDNESPSYRKSRTIIHNLKKPKSTI